MNSLFAAVLQVESWQPLGLAFLLGSFTVATLSDLRRLSAQREFVEIWWLFALVVLVLEVLSRNDGDAGTRMLMLKWGLIAALSLVSWVKIGWLFRLAPGDVAALAAAASLLPCWWVPAYYGVAKVMSWWLGPLLTRGRGVYPFMPVVSAATIVVLGVVLSLQKTGVVAPP
jgi:hypothetical protein